MTAEPTVSIIVASTRPPGTIRPTIGSLRTSMQNYAGTAELLVVRDCSAPDDVLIGISLPAPVRVLRTGGNSGSALSRKLGIDASRGAILLFTDDDVTVPANWVTEIAEAVSRHGTCTGGVARRNEGFWALCDERIDGYRVNARDRDGHAKFLSFPNFGIRRDLLPDPPFDLSTQNKADDPDLACRLRLTGVSIHVNTSLTVWADYPATYWGFLRRKIRHGVGMGQLRASLGRKVWRQLDLGSLPELIRRWITLSTTITTGGRPDQRVLGLLANLVYCAALAGTAAAETMRMAAQQQWRRPRTAGMSPR